MPQRKVKCQLWSLSFTITGRQTWILICYLLVQKAKVCLPFHSKKLWVSSSSFHTFLVQNKADWQKPGSGPCTKSERVLEWDVKLLKLFGVNTKFYCGTIPYKPNIVSKTSFSTGKLRTFSTQFWICVVKFTYGWNRKVQVLMAEQGCSCLVPSPRAPRTSQHSRPCPLLLPCCKSVPQEDFQQHLGHVPHLWLSMEAAAPSQRENCEERQCQVPETRTLSRHSSGHPDSQEACGLWRGSAVAFPHENFAWKANECHGPSLAPVKRVSFPLCSTLLPSPCLCFFWIRMFLSTSVNTHCGKLPWEHHFLVDLPLS